MGDKMVKQLVDAVPVSDTDYILVSQPGIAPNGNTRKITVGDFKSYLGSGAGSGNTGSGSALILGSPFLFASGKRELTIKAGTKIGSFFAGSDQVLNVVSLLDAGSLVAGKDYYVYRCNGQGGAADYIKISLSKAAPAGLSSSAVDLIGGFHTLCVNAGSGMTYLEGGVTKQHPLNGYVAGDMLPYSVWCLNHRPYSEPEGMVYIPSLDFWADIYLQSGSGADTKSVYQGAVTRSRQYVDFVEDQFIVKKELLDDAEFAAAMLGSNEQTTVAGSSETGATSGGAGGRSDTANKRMISIYGIEEGCGSLWQYLRTTSAGGAVGSIYGQTATTPTYGWIAQTTSAYGPFGQAGGKGSFWGLAGALLAGGSWAHSSGCGSQARDADSSRSCAGAHNGGRGRSRPMRFMAY